MGKYPHPCCRCGFCCLVERCPVSRNLFGDMTGEVCDHLSFDGPVANCELVAELGEKALGIGEGCCISARVISQMDVLDFAVLPSWIKVRAVRALKMNTLTVLRKEKENA